jgi:lipopolysaccharide assembly protein A
LFLYGLLGLLVVLFVIQNYTILTYSISIRLNLGFLTLESIPLPFFVIAPILFFAGVLLATGIGLIERRRLSKELKQVKTDLQESKQREKPLGDLSSPPVPPIEKGDSPPNNSSPIQS